MNLFKVNFSYSVVKHIEGRNQRLTVQDSLILPRNDFLEGDLTLCFSECVTRFSGSDSRKEETTTFVTVYRSDSGKYWLARPLVREGVHDAILVNSRTAGSTLDEEDLDLLVHYNHQYNTFTLSFIPLNLGGIPTDYLKGGGPPLAKFESAREEALRELKESYPELVFYQGKRLVPIERPYIYFIKEPIGGSTYTPEVRYDQRGTKRKAGICAEYDKMQEAIDYIKNDLKRSVNLPTWRIDVHTPSVKPKTEVAP